MPVLGKRPATARPRPPHGRQRRGNAGVTRHRHGFSMPIRDLCRVGCVNTAKMRQSKVRPRTHHHRASAHACFTGFHAPRSQGEHHVQVFEDCHSDCRVSFSHPPPPWPNAAAGVEAVVAAAVNPPAGPAAMMPAFSRCCTHRRRRLLHRHVRPASCGRGAAAVRRAKMAASNNAAWVGIVASKQLRSGGVERTRRVRTSWLQACALQPHFIHPALRLLRQEFPPGDTRVWEVFGMTRR